MIFHREKKMNKPVAFPGNASNPMYRKELEEHVRTGTCPFCKQLAAGNREILATRGEWVLSPNSYPQRDTENGVLEVALLIICRQHITSQAELSVVNPMDAYALFENAVQKYGLEDGCVLAIRVGGEITGQTLPHLHWQILRPRKRSDGTGILFNFHVGHAFRG